MLVGKFSLNINSIGIQFVVRYRICPGITFGQLTILFRFQLVFVAAGWTFCCCRLDVLLLLLGRFVPTKVIHVRNKDKPFSDDQCRHAFVLKQEAHLWWTRYHSQVNWERFVCCQVGANETYSETKHQFVKTGMFL